MYMELIWVQAWLRRSHDDVHSQMIWFFTIHHSCKVLPGLWLLEFQRLFHRDFQSYPHHQFWSKPRMIEDPNQKQLGAQASSHDWSESDSNQAPVLNIKSHPDWFVISKWKSLRLSNMRASLTLAAASSCFKFLIPLILSISRGVSCSLFGTELARSWENYLPSSCEDEQIIPTTFSCSSSYQDMSFRPQDILVKMNAPILDIHGADRYR